MSILPPQINTKSDTNSFLDDEEFKRRQRERVLECQTYRDDAFLAMFCPTGQLTRDKVLDYFCQISNPFYDKDSANQRAKVTNAPKTDILKLRLDGTHYLLENPKKDARLEKQQQQQNSPFPPGERQMHIIRQAFKRDKNQDKLETQKFYYLYNGGVVYPAPNLYALITSRLHNSVALLTDSFKNGVSNFARFSNFTGKYYWDFSANLKKEEKEEKENGNKKKKKKSKSKKRNEDKMEIEEEDNSNMMEEDEEEETSEEENEENEENSDEENEENEAEREKNEEKEKEKEGDIHIQVPSYSPYPSIVKRRFDENLFRLENEIRNMVENKK